MVNGIGTLLMLLTMALLAICIPVLAIWLVYKVLLGIGWVLWSLISGLGKGISWGFRGVGNTVHRILTFVRNSVLDTLRFAGAALTSIFMVPPVIGNVCVGRWSAANHYGRAFEREIREACVRLYRVLLGNPIKLLGLTPLIEGIEGRLPDVVAHSPGADRPKGGAERFPGYRVIGSLPRGGSGARLFLGELTPEKADEFARAGTTCPGQIVIKAFSLEDGSTLPQIVRESRSLDAARKLGLILDHKLESDSFYYVMPFVPGSDLAEVTRRLHLNSAEEGLKDKELGQALHFSSQLLMTLDRFHTTGVWHKDIKPTNIIISDDGGAHLVDFGLVTSLRSAMTLTTHGTEYFRDPEMVKLAMQGVKVHEVDGAKFDLYSMGAVIYSMLENSFPAQGGLSRITRRCPESLRWIVRRAMADTRNRYASASEMLTDLRALMGAKDPFAVEPADLPSLSGKPALAGALDQESVVEDMQFPVSSTPIRPVTSAPAKHSIGKAGKGRSKTKQSIAMGVGVAAAIFVVLVVGLIDTVGRQSNRPFVASSNHTHVAQQLLGRSHQVDAHASPTPVLSDRPSRVRNSEEHFDNWDRAQASADRAHAGEQASIHDNWQQSIKGDLNRILGRDSNRSQGKAQSSHQHVLADMHGRRGQNTDMGPSMDMNVEDLPRFEVLVVNDLPPSFDSDKLSQLSQSLANRNFVLRGLDTDQPIDDIELQRLAKIRQTAGVQRELDSNSLLDIKSFYYGEDPIDAILWLTSGESKDEFSYRVWTRTDVEQASANLAVQARY